MKTKDLLNEALKPTNEKKGFSTKEIKEHYGHVADIIIHMSAADSDGDEGEFEDNLGKYGDTAFDEISEIIEEKLVNFKL